MGDLGSLENSTHDIFGTSTVKQALHLLVPVDSSIS
jgi:hypothetical protein